ncbi:MAG: AAA family ATPase [Clostridia bacterium]|nr:AAA family ATPase [Clostridia bacterium]
MARRYIKHLKMTPYEGSDYVATLPVVRWLNRQKELDLDCDVTFFVGENGAGKSTLLEAIAVAAGFNAEGGSKNYNFSTRQTVSNLHQSLTLAKADYEQDGFFLRAEGFYNVATHLEELDKIPADAPPLIDSYGGRSLHELSHGESFLALVQHRFGGEGLYLLDEPEAALSPTRQITLLQEMKRLVAARSQFIIATHSPILLSFPGARIYQFSEFGIQQVAYEQCLHVQLTKRFLENPARYME